MYRRIAFAAADLSLAVGGMLLLWGLLRPHADVQRVGCANSDVSRAGFRDVGLVRWRFCSHC
jgi:hypothetical protein